MTSYLVDIALMRQGELTRQLAGCASLDPVAILPVISQKLKTTDLTDEKARDFICQLQDHFDELKSVNDNVDGVFKIVFKLATEDKILFDFLGWITSFDDTAKKVGLETIREIQRSAIAIKYFQDLQEYALAVERRSAWRRV